MLLLADVVSSFNCAKGYHATCLEEESWGQMVAGSVQYNCLEGQCKLVNYLYIALQ